METGGNSTRTKSKYVCVYYNIYVFFLLCRWRSLSFFFQLRYRRLATPTYEIKHLLGIPLHVIYRITLPDQYNIGRVAFSRLLLDDAENLTLDILPEFPLAVSSLRKSVMECLGARPEHNDELEPAFREEIARMIIDNTAAG